MNKPRFMAVALLLCLLLLCCEVGGVHAEDFFTLDVDMLDMDSLNSNEYVARYLSAQTQGIRVRKYISDTSELAAGVRLTLVQMDSNTLLFDKDYGYQSGTFDSGVIYLPYVDNRTIPYLVTLYVADYVFAMPFMHLQPRLSYNSGCTFGVRLRDLNPGLTQDWQMGTMVDLNALRSQGSMTVPVCASNAFIVGQATLAMRGEVLSVSLAFLTSANVEVHHIALYVITDCASMTTADVLSISQPAYGLGDGIDVTGAASALVYMPIQLSYDSVGLNTFGYDLSSGELQTQVSLWNTNRSTSGGQGSAEETGGEFADGSSWNGDVSGWDANTGWNEDGGNSGWNENDSNVGWNEDNSNTGWVEDDSNTGWNEDGGNIGWDESNSNTGWNEDNSNIGWNEDDNSTGWNEDGGNIVWNEDDSNVGWNEDSGY